MPSRCEYERQISPNTSNSTNTTFWHYSSTHPQDTPRVAVHVLRELPHVVVDVASATGGTTGVLCGDVATPGSGHDGGFRLHPAESTLGCQHADQIDPTAWAALPPVR
ncbi:hypothetical protein MTO96_024806 [Rhipicephalus appendiculatus]